ncbi:hypothetical protein EJ04DRAFT_171859 [Polyplosphaeria fusca]|uniref:Uncharacterized protein n=1 Tax=Polyplosphaeria fusca TaxID=682080 RepID=A0A9P4QKV1_9PLEO|nr:hypothetical protein EJ04DRAFT_171859 [Polyplosphaeria fusca]
MSFVPINHSFTKKPKLRTWGHIYLVLVTRGTNPEAVKRAVSTMRPLHSIDKRIQLIVLTDEGAKPDKTTLKVDVQFVPTSFHPRTAK